MNQESGTCRAKHRIFLYTLACHSYHVHTYCEFRIVMGSTNKEVRASPTKRLEQGIPGWKFVYQLSERLMPLDIMGAQLMNPLIP